MDGEKRKKDRTERRENKRQGEEKMIGGRENRDREKRKEKK